MEEEGVTVDRSLLLGFLEKNGGRGCHGGQVLIAWFPTKEWRIRMSCRTGPRCSVSYKRMEEKDAMSGRTLLVGFVQGNER